MRNLKQTLEIEKKKLNQGRKNGSNGDTKTKRERERGKKRIRKENRFFKIFFSLFIFILYTKLA